MLCEFDSVCNCFNCVDGLASLFVGKFFLRVVWLRFAIDYIWKKNADGKNDALQNIIIDVDVYANVVNGLKLVIFAYFRVIFAILAIFGEYSIYTSFINGRNKFVGRPTKLLRHGAFRFWLRIIKKLSETIALEFFDYSHPKKMSAAP